MQAPHAPQMFFERRDELFGQHADAVFRAFAVAHDDLPVAEIQIFNAQPQAFFQTQTRAVKQIRHQPVNAFKIR